MGCIIKPSLSKDKMKSDHYTGCCE
jgi:hypothetical protein